MQRQEYLNEADLSQVLAAIFDSRAIVYEAYSAYERELLSFSNFASLKSYISSFREQKNFICVSIHYPDTGGNTSIRRIALNPAKCNGASYRYAAEGWGLIQLQMDFAKSPMVQVRLAVNTLARANAWAPTYPEMESPEAWNWRLVEKQARRLIRVLRKHALARNNDRQSA